MIGKLSSLILLLYITISFPLFANNADISVKASVNQTVLTINDILRYKITITGAKGQPTINESFLKDFSVINRSSQQSYQLINNDFFSSQIKSFQLRPNIEGTIIIPSAKVNIAGQSYETDPITITVTSGGSSSLTPAPSTSQSTSSLPKKTSTSSSGIPPGSSKDLFILASLDKQDAYVGEEIIYSIHLYRRFSAIDQLLYQEPEFGMLSEQLQRDQNTYTKVYQGIRYYVQEIDRRALFSYEPGPVSIDPSTAEVQINFFYGRQVIKSNPVSIIILPLPEEEKPPNFSGLVGQFLLDVDVNTNALVENKPIAIRLSVTGSGNLKQLSDLSFNTDPDVFKVYQSSTNDLITYIDSVKGVRHFEYIMVPKIDGTFSLPTFSFSFFNPQSKLYKTVTSDLTTVSVIDSGESSLALASTDSGNSITELRQDLRYIKESINFSNQAKPFFKQFFSLFLILLNVLFFSSITASFISKTQFYKMLSHSFSLKPSKQAVHTLEKIKSDSNWAISDVQNSIFMFISSIINKPAQGLPISEIISELAKKQIDSAAITDLQTLLDQCSFLAYAPESSNQTSKIDICDQAIDIIKRIT